MLLFLIKEVIIKLKEAKYFNKLDFIWGYNNEWIKESNKWKVSFLMNKGLFKPKVIYFGLCNSLGTFQRMINSIFQKLLHRGVLVNYMDNFVILVKTKKELEEQTINFLKIAENITFVSNGQSATLMQKKYLSLEQQLDKKKFKWKTIKLRQSQNRRHLPR